MKHRIWDLQPDGGGEPVAIDHLHGIDAAEAVERHPERYTRIAPEGTVEFELDKRRAERDAKLAEIAESERTAMREIDTKRQEAIDKIAAEDRDAKSAEAERVRAEQAEKGAVATPNRQGEIDQIDQKALQERTRIKLDHDQKRAELLNAPAEPVVVQEHEESPEVEQETEQHREERLDRERIEEDHE